MSENNTHADNSTTINNKPKAYEGTDPFLFISYARKDSEIVLPIIKHLQSRGVRLWYDEGIELTEALWEKIASKIDKCHIYVAFLTENFYSSRWCKDEFYHAYDKNKIILPIQLDEKPDFYKSRFPLDRCLMITMPKDSNLDNFYCKILKTKGIDQCIAKPAATSESNPEKASHGKMAQVITNSVPTHPSVYFQGRETALKEIKALAKEKVVLLNGIGGIGKTEICRRIFWDYRKNPADGVEYLGWIFYENSLASSLSGKFPKIKETDPENYKDAVQRLIEEYGDRLLLFVDNANELYSDEKTDDKDWLNSLSCRMILTSRTEIKCFDQYRIDTLLPEQCRSVYQQNSEDNDPESIPFIDEIIRLAAYHTQTVELLAKTQAASCMSAKELRDALREHGFTLKDVLETVDSSHAGKDSNERLIEHLAMIFDIAQIKDDEAIRILRMFSLLTTNMPIEVKTLKNWMELSNLNAINDLVRYGWLKKNKHKDEWFFSIHPVIAETVKYKCPPDCNFAEKMVKKMTEILNEHLAASTSVSDEALSHFTSVANSLREIETDYLAWFFDRIGMIMYQNGNAQLGIWTAYQRATDQPVEIACEIAEPIFEKSLVYLRKALAIEENLVDSDSMHLSNIYIDIAWAYNHKREWNTALDFLKKSLEICDKSHLNGLDSALIYHDIALTYRYKGDIDEALKYHRMDLSIVKQVLGAESRDAAMVYCDIAESYFQRGQNKKITTWKDDLNMTIEYYNKAIKVYESALGKQDLQIVKLLLYKTAYLYYALGQYKEAVKCEKKAHAYSKKAWLSSE